MITFVAHEAKRTGAPIALLNFLRWLRSASSLDFSVIVGADGPLVERFAALAPVALAGKASTRLLAAADLVVANSTASHALLDALAPFDAPVLSHVHELRRGLAPVDVLRAGKRPAHYVAVSRQVRDVLVSDYPIADHEVTVCDGFVWTDDVTSAGRRGGPDEAPWEPFGIPRGSHVVGAVGSIWPYKGPDIFVELAAHVLAHPAVPPDTHFVWIGGPHDRALLMQDWVDAAGIGHRVHLIGEVEEPHPLMAALDVFVVPSREDPFPLVLMEAGALGRCSVAFAAGGATQLLADDRGVLIEPFGIETMTAIVVELLHHPDRRDRLGTALATHVHAEHDVAVRAPAILDAIGQALDR